MQNNAFPKQKEIIDIYKQKTLNFNNFPTYAEMRNSQDFVDTIHYTMKSMTYSGNYYYDFLCALDEKIASGKIPTEKIGGAKNAELLEDSCGHNLVVECNASDLVARVQFSLPAPLIELYLLNYI